MKIDKSVMRIAIIGGGPGGLCLARLLQVVGFLNVKVYENDDSPLTRQQGGLLDLKPTSGQLALRKAGLYEGWLGAVASSDSPLTVKDKTGTTLLQIDRKSTPEVERQVLKMLLTKSLIPNSIVYGAKFTSLRSDGDGTRKIVSFLHHPDVAADLVVGADGAWSKVRPYVHNVRPTYSGITFIDGKILDRSPEIRKAMGPAVLLALSDSKAIMAGPLTSMTASVYAASRKDEGWHRTPAISQASAEALHNHAVEMFKDWALELQKIVRHIVPDTIVIRPIYFLTPGLSWATKSGITLLGDAAHLMSPFAGEGVNMALWDSLMLADALGAEGDLNSALENYEKKMFLEAKIKTIESAKNLELFFREKESAKGVVELFRERA